MPKNTYILEDKENMAEAEGAKRSEQAAVDVAGLDLAIGGEPHPADLLASLTKADNAAGERRGSEVVPPARETANAKNAAPATEATTSNKNSAPPVIGASTPPTIDMDPRKGEAIPAAARALAAQPTESEASAMQRAMRALTAALPLLQRLAPILEGNILTALANVLSPMPHAPPPPKPVNLSSIEEGIGELKAQHRELRTQLQDHSTSMKRLSDQVELVRQATDRNTSEQQELIDELKSAGRKMNVVALVAFALLAASIAVNVYLYFQIHRLLP